MSKAFRITLSLLLCCLILVSGSGLIIGKMVCQRSGYSEIVAQEAEHCCKLADACCEAETEADFSFDDNCCDVKNFAFETCDFTPASATFIKAPAPLTLLFIPGNFHENNFTPSRTARNVYPPDPLIRAGSETLPVLGVFRI